MGLTQCAVPGNSEALVRHQEAMSEVQLTFSGVPPHIALHIRGCTSYRSWYASCWRNWYAVKTNGLAMARCNVANQVNIITLPQEPTKRFYDKSFSNREVYLD